jgi:uncharacterized membrane protein
MVEVLYAGDAAIVVGPMVIESPFDVGIKDAYVREWGHYLTDALSGDSEISITYMPSVKAYREFPRTDEDLEKYDVILLSDVTSEVLRFYPEFFPIEKLRELSIFESKEYVGMPDRLDIIKKFVENGGGFIMAGGWFSFSGRFGHGGWYRTPVAELLPVQVSEVDDRVEAPTGATVKAVDKEAPVMKNIPWDTCPPFLGYNRVRLKKDSRLLAVIGKQADPFIVTGKYGKGRVMAFTSDPVLHWGINFVKWKYYPKFWSKAMKWIAGEKRTNTNPL